MAYLTRHSEAKIGGSTADHAPPVYHDDCTDAGEDHKGRALCWVPDSWLGSWRETEPCMGCGGFI